MSARDDGGPAYPAPDKSGQEFGLRGVYAGMSLRDWFAGQALAGQLSDPTTDGDPTSRALWAYKYADAMLKERAKCATSR